MKYSEITANIKNKLGIAELNAMQIAVGASTAHKLILLAPTGSGKTVAFAIALLRSLKPSTGSVQGVVMAPSRELVLQICDVVRRIATGYKTVAFYGGHAMSEEVNSLSQTPDIIVATPGRLLDHVKPAQVTITVLGSWVSYG
ncbi:MAG: DEAD/DEAH box helicase [Muribaculaceae bacterium]|nr:DEAD/DEAH box helicase [Muribaculaceae bacterium]